MTSTYRYNGRIDTHYLMAATSHNWASDKTLTQAPRPYLFRFWKISSSFPKKKQCARSEARPKNCKNKLITCEAKKKKEINHMRAKQPEIYVFI